MVFVDSWYVAACHSKETNFVSEKAQGSETKECRKTRESLGNPTSEHRRRDGSAASRRASDDSL